MQPNDHATVRLLLNAASVALLAALLAGLIVIIRDAVLAGATP